MLLKDKVCVITGADSARGIGKATARVFAAQGGRGGRLDLVAENHSVIGGLGEAVASLLLHTGTVPPGYRQIGLPDAFRRGRSAHPARPLRHLRAGRGPRHPRLALSRREAGPSTSRVGRAVERVRGLKFVILLAGVVSRCVLHGSLAGSDERAASCS